MYARTQIDSPVGTLAAVAREDALVMLEFDSDDRASTAIERLGSSTRDIRADEHPILAQTEAELSEYFAGRRLTFTIPLAPVGTDFERRAWDALLTIPFGQTRSYMQQAVTLGVPGAVRAVGRANGRNHLAIVIPCHRVIGANGSLTGYGGGLERKRWLLDHERHVVGDGLFDAIAQPVGV
jgi:O-6-methylguanine DNA methyltransferase